MSQPDCLQKAVKGKRLERSLECPISPEIIETLKQGMVK
ncbi:YlxR family protein [Desulforamulus profundi]